LKIGAVGLGIGTIGAYVGPGDSIRFYEINPAVIDIAAGGKWFTFLEDCQKRGGHVDTKLGDARLTIERELLDEPSKRYDLLVLDAFSGDAIPVHLLTEEAFKVYMQRLGTHDADGRDGVIAVHIQNHYVGLEPVVRALAERFGLKYVRIKNPKIPGVGVYASEWMILSKDEGLIQSLAPFAAAPDPDAAPKPAILWTDGRSNLFDVLK
jgi:spermidine synthase